MVFVGPSPPPELSINPVILRVQHNQSENKRGKLHTDISETNVGADIAPMNNLS